MGTKSPGGPQRCRLILQHCLAIQLSKPGITPDDFWMYDSGYMIFQNFLAANAQCWWNAPLTAATRALRYAGHVAPGMLLVTAEPCALEVLRGAYARSVLKPPATYIISSVGDIDDCIITPTLQGQFTPLSEALCDVIMELTSQGQSATIENLKVMLNNRFPHVTAPAVEVIYDTLAQLMKERKIYQTSKGYFIVTPERRRSRSRPKIQKGYQDYEEDSGPQDARVILMTNVEALHSFYGEISTERDGDLTHQCIQTNLADVICGGNPNDKILYPRTSKRRSASFPTPRSLERRHSLRFFGSSKRLQRCASTRSLSKSYAQTITTDSSSSEYQSTDSSSPKKGSLLSRLFRRSTRTTNQRQIKTFSAQFPPVEWFNSRTVHLHSIGTQTMEHDIPTIHTLSNSTFYDGSEISQRSSTLPRRHRRHMSSESTFVISSRDCSPIRRRSPTAYYSSSLPRSTQSIPATSNTQNVNTVQTSHTNQTRLTKIALNKQNYDENQRCGLNKKIDNRILNSRNIQSGPSSLDSGKISIATSGPSSIESNKSIYGRRSGHSSLESQISSSNMINSSGSRSILLLNGSPRSSPKHQTLKLQKSSDYCNNKNINYNKIDKNLPQMVNKGTNGIINSNSNNSITLQVTTSNSNQNNHLPNTKIYVQNSPIRSVITFENGKLNDNSNVYIINNETSTNEKGEILTKKLTRQQNTLTRKPLIKTNSNNENEFNSDICDSISFINDILPESNDILPINTNEKNKFIKNLKNNDTTMNNSRKLSFQLIQNSCNTNQSNGNIVYKNVFNNDSNNSSPTILGNAPLAEKQDFELCGSTGNLNFYEKNKTLGSQNKLNSNCDLKNYCYETTSSGNILHKKNIILNSNPAINTDSLANLLQKNIITVGSEPNLAIKKSEQLQKTLNENKTIDKEYLDRRLSITKDNNEDLYNFPSLTDLSFNFTSLAAQKILQGVSLNSIDTLVELNIANNKEKQQNNKTSKICKDYGLV